MFFRKQAQTDLTTKLVDDLLEAPAEKRRAMIDAAIRGGTIKPPEDDELLRLVARLESVLRPEAPEVADTAAPADASSYAA